MFGLGGDDVVHGHAAADEVYGNDDFAAEADPNDPVVSRGEL